MTFNRSGSLTLFIIFECSLNPFAFDKVRRQRRILINIVVLDKINYINLSSHNLV